MSTNFGITVNCNNFDKLQEALDSCTLSFQGRNKATIKVTKGTNDVLSLTSFATADQVVDNVLGVGESFLTILMNWIGKITDDLTLETGDGDYLIYPHNDTPNYSYSTVIFDVDSFMNSVSHDLSSVECNQLSSFIQPSNRTLILTTKSEKLPVVDVDNFREVLSREIVQLERRLETRSSTLNESIRTLQRDLTSSQVSSDVQDLKSQFQKMFELIAEGIADFSAVGPEGDDVPKYYLPEILNKLKSVSDGDTSSSEVLDKLAVVVSHSDALSQVVESIPSQIKSAVVQVLDSDVSVFADFNSRLSELMELVKSDVKTDEYNKNALGSLGSLLTNTAVQNMITNVAMTAFQLLLTPDYKNKNNNSLASNSSQIPESVENGKVNQENGSIFKDPFQ